MAHKNIRICYRKQSEKTQSMRNKNVSLLTCHAVRRARQAGNYTGINFTPYPHAGKSIAYAVEFNGSSRDSDDYSS